MMKVNLRRVGLEVNKSKRESEENEMKEEEKSECEKKDKLKKISLERPCATSFALGRAHQYQGHLQQECRFI